MENLEKQHFNSEQELISHLSKCFYDINRQCPSNVFIHQIRDYSRSEYHNIGEKTVIPKMQAILREGLIVSQYSTIYGTMRCVGDTLNVDYNKMLNTSYYEEADPKAKVIFVFPKKVEVLGKDIEFSSFKGQTDVLSMEDLKACYVKKLGNKPANHHVKFCLLDALKGLNNISNCYILGVVLSYKNKEGYDFINPNTHLMYGNNGQNFESHALMIESKTIKLYEKYGENLEDILVEAYKKEEAYLDYLNSFDI